MRAVWEFSVQAWEDASRAPNERLRVLGLVGPGCDPLRRGDPFRQRRLRFSRHGSLTQHPVHHQPIPVLYEHAGSGAAGLVGCLSVAVVCCIQTYLPRVLQRFVAMARLSMVGSRKRAGDAAGSLRGLPRRRPSGVQK